MLNLLSVLKRPNRLDELSEGPTSDRPWLWSTTRGQVLILHMLGRAYIILACLGINFTTVFLGLPLLYQDSPSSLLCRQLLMVYICFHMVTNFVFVFYFAKKSHFGFSGGRELPFNVVKNIQGQDSGSGSDEVNSPDLYQQRHGWIRCKYCDIDVPPRTRHCSICQTCILKKDHHCFFTGCCIGFYNQRFFITFCLFGFLAGTWAVYNFSAYLSLHYAPVIGLQIYKYFLPYCLIAWLLGYSSLYNIGLVLLLYLHVTCTATTTYYFFWQMLVILRGQTTYEFVKGRKIYSSDFWWNIRSVFGRYWLLGILFPVPAMLNEGDGIHWKPSAKSV